MNKIKVGDRVRIIATARELSNWTASEEIKTGKIYKVMNCNNRGINLDIVAVNNHIKFAYCEKVEEALVPHVHADLIKAWADGHKIESRRKGKKDWCYMETPGWAESFDWRIKPTKSATELQIEKLEEELSKLKQTVKEERNQ